jgi:hypothetical protein
MPPEIFPIQSRRAVRQRRMQIVQHVFAAILLFNTGVAAGADSPLAIAEIVAGGLLVIAVLRERIRPSHHGNLAWVELAGAVMITVEAIEKMRTPHHVSFIILTFIQPLILFVFAIFDAKISHARYLKADDDDLEVRLRLLFRRRIRWADIRSFYVQADMIIFAGAKKLTFKDVINRDEAMQWTVEQLQRRGINESVAH